MSDKRCLIQDVVSPHCGDKRMAQHCGINLYNISIKTNFKQLRRVELKVVQYSEGDYILCMMSRYFCHLFTNVTLLCFVSHSNDIMTMQSLVPTHYVCNTIVSNHFHSVKSLLISSARPRDFDGMLGTGLPVSMYTTKTPIDMRFPFNSFMMLTAVNKGRKQLYF
jgi:hypothetical protein